MMAINLKSVLFPLPAENINTVTFDLQQNSVWEDVSPAAAKSINSTEA